MICIRTDGQGRCFENYYGKHDLCSFLVPRRDNAGCYDKSYCIMDWQDVHGIPKEGCPAFNKEEQAVLCDYDRKFRLVYE